MQSCNAAMHAAHNNHHHEISIDAPSHKRYDELCLYCEHTRTAVKRLALATIGCLICSALYAQPANLKSVLIDAVHKNPGYLQDIAQFHVIAENVPQQRAALLPQLDSIAEYSRERHARSGRGNGYVSTNHLGLELSQTIFNGEQIKALDVAKLATKSAAYNLLAQQQQLIIDVASAYFQVLRAKDLLSYTRQQFRFSREQSEATEIRHNHGESTVTEFEQAKGRAVLLKGELVTAEMNLYNAKQALIALTDSHYPRLQSLRHFKLVTPIPNRLGAWIKTLRHKNLTLLADQYTLKSLKNKITEAKAEYLPTLNAVSNYDSQQRPNFNGNQVVSHHSDNFEVGANMTWSLFEGGLRYAQVRQVMDEYNAASQKLHQDFLNAGQQATSSFNDVVMGIRRIRANRDAITTNQKALNYAEEGYRAGTETITGVLQIQTQLFSSQRQYATDYYAYLLAILRLKQAAGILSLDNLL